MSSLRSTYNIIKEISKNRNILVLMSTQALFMFTAFLWWPYRSLYIKELGASNQLLGSLLTLETLASIMFQLPGGILADRWGRKRMLVISGFMRLGSPIIYLFATNWTHTIPAIILASAGMLGLPANNALIAESIPVEKRGTGFAAYRTVTSIPTIVTGLMGGMIMDYFGVLSGSRLVLIASILTSLLSFGVRWKYLTETFDPSKIKGALGRKRKGVLQQIRSLPREIWILTIVAAISAFAVKLMVSFMVIYGVEVVGLTTTQWGLIGTAVAIITTLLSTPSGIMADKIGKKPVILASRSLVSLSILGFTFSNNFTHMFLVRSLGGIGNGMGGAMWGPIGGPVWQALIADLSPPEERGQIVGLMGTISSLVSSPASWAGGYMTDNISPHLPFRLSFVLDLIGTLIMFVFLKTKEPPNPLNEAESLPP